MPKPTKSEPKYIAKALTSIKPKAKAKPRFIARLSRSIAAR